MNTSPWGGASEVPRVLTHIYKYIAIVISLNSGHLVSHAVRLSEGSGMCLANPLSTDRSLIIRLKPDLLSAFLALEFFSATCAKFIE